MTQMWLAYKLADLCEVFTDGDWIESKDQSDTGVLILNPPLIVQISKQF